MCISKNNLLTSEPWPSSAISVSSIIFIMFYFISLWWKFYFETFIVMIKLKYLLLLRKMHLVLNGTILPLIYSYWYHYLVLHAVVFINSQYCLDPKDQHLQLCSWYFVSPSLRHCVDTWASNLLLNLHHAVCCVKNVCNFY